MILPYGFFYGFGFEEIFSFKYGIVLILSALCVLQAFEFANDKFETIIPMMYIFSITQFQLIPVVIVSVSVNILNAIIRKFRTKEATNLLNIKSIFNLMSDVIGITIAVLIYQVVVKSFGFFVAIVSASITVASINILLVTIVMYLYSQSSTNVSLRMIGSHFINNIGTSVILIYAYEAYHYTGFIFAGLFMLIISSQLTFSITKESIEKEVYSDALTGAYNRGYLDKVLYDRLVLKETFTILFLDFDKFKSINDIYGHSVGDSVLKHFVSELQLIIQQDAKIFRYGGDEFCILVDQKNHVDNIIERLENFNTIAVYVSPDNTIKYSFTIGLLSYCGLEELSLSDVYSKASKQMLTNKKIEEKVLLDSVVLKTNS